MPWDLRIAVFDKVEVKIGDRGFNMRVTDCAFWLFLKKNLIVGTCVLCLTIYPARTFYIGESKMCI